MKPIPDIVASWLGSAASHPSDSVGVVERGSAGCAAGSGFCRSAPAYPYRDHRRLVDDFRRRNRREHRVAHDWPRSACGVVGPAAMMLSYSLAVASLYIAAGALGQSVRQAATLRRSGSPVSPRVHLVRRRPEYLGPSIAGRVLQGVFGALLATSSLALLRATFGADSGRAVGQWTAWTGISTLTGPPTGGLLVEYASWPGYSSSTCPQRRRRTPSPSGAGSTSRRRSLRDRL